MTWILHVSDPHLGDVGAVELDDTKEIFDAPVDVRTTQKVFAQTLGTLTRFAEEHGPPEFVVVSGDLSVAAHPSGFKAFLELLEEHPDVFPADRSRIVVVPGNHDVVWDEKPGDAARYAGFVGATRATGCTTPLLDGIDCDAEGRLLDEATKHPHLVDTPEVLIIPINSSNYCGVMTTPRNAWTVDEWHAALNALNADTDEVVKQLKKLHQRDVARVSDAQIRALGRYFDKEGVSREPVPGQLRVAVLHHHLLPVSLNEERKAFESLVNLEAVRDALRSYGVDVVLHGHKHQSSMYWDSAGAPHDLDGPQSRTLVVSSPGHFDVKQPAMRALLLQGGRTARNLRIITFAGASASRKRPDIVEDQTVALWARVMDAEPGPRITVSGETAGVTYSRLQALFQRAGGEGATHHNLVCIIDDPVGATSIPTDYPPIEPTERERWFNDLVNWWQQRDPELVRHGVLPFNHGHRVRRRWGDQVQRAVRMLDARPESSRALLQLIGPRETGRYGDDERPLDTGTYPAFVVAEFVVRDGRLDCISFFRKQEMQFWWPINVAELARLQATIARDLASPLPPGRIVTFSAVALWKDKLPAVAVPAVDLLVETQDRLWGMAVAVARPDHATAEARADWRQVLEDLKGPGRRSRVGADLLSRHVRRLADVAPSTPLEQVAVALENLVEQYGILAETETLNSKAVTAIQTRVEAVRAAVEQALS